MNDFTKPSLTDQLTERLIQEIRSGVLQPGQQLPTGQDLSKRFNVSLSVVREAISSLKAEGLIQTRQGAGAFVSATTRPFRLTQSQSTPIGPQKVFELRTGIEMQAAALAAERASKKQLQAIRDAYRAMEIDIAADQESVASDVLFHKRIAEASGNELFPSFLDFLADHIRSTIKESREDKAIWNAQCEDVMAEHQALMEAICSRNIEAAREAAYTHMANCLTRCLP